MKTKHTILSFALLALASTSIAVITQPFSGWNNLIGKAPDIIIARCSKTPGRSVVQKNGIVLEFKDGIIRSDVEVVSVLKGATNLGPALLTSQYWPRQGEQYLIFATYHDGFYQAIETYRVMPLGMSFPTNMLVGKSLNEQIQSVFQYRLNHLNQELEQGKEEKKRLEEGLKR